MEFFNENKFHRFLWFDPVSRDINIYNPKRIAQIAEDVKATVVHYAAVLPLSGKTFYPSKYRSMEPTANNRDLLGEVVEECHKRGIKLVAYFNCHWLPEDIFPKNVEWLAITHTGEPYKIHYGSGSSPCINSPEFVKNSINICSEMTQNYDIDGIFLDGPSVPIDACYCKHCQNKFEERYNAQIPKKELWGEEIWENFISFRNDSISEYLDTIRREVKKIRDIPIYNNGAPLTTIWFNALSSEEHAPYSDIVGGEHFVFYHEPINTPIWGASAAAKYYKGIAREEKPAIVYGCYAHKIWDFYPLPADDIKQIIAEMIANGAYPFVAIDDYLTINDPLNLKPIKDMYSFIEENEKYYLDAESDNNVALLWSQHTADYYTRGKIAGAAGTHHFEVASDKEYIKEFEGFYDILTQSHIPFDIIIERDITKSALSKYDCLLLPNVACITKGQAETIKEFVKEGGCLIASHETSLYKLKGVPYENFILSELLGVTLGNIKNLEELRKKVFDTCIDYQKIMHNHEITKDMREYIPCSLRNIKTKSLGKGKVLAKFMTPLKYRYDSFNGESEYPSIILNAYGEGKVLYFAGNVGALYKIYNIRDIRDIFYRSICWMIDVPIILENKYSLDINLTKTKDESKIIHIINWSSRIRRPVDEIVPVRDVTFKMKCENNIKSVKSLATKKTLNFKKYNNIIEVCVPEIRNYDAIVLE